MRAAHRRPHCSSPPGRGSRVWSLKHVLESAQENVGFVSRERERRKHTQDPGIGGDTGEDAMLEQCPLHLGRGALQVQTEEQAFTTDPSYSGVQCALRQIAADIYRVLNEMFILYDTNVGERGCTRQRSSAERTAEVPQREGSRDILCRDYRPYRKPCGETLGQCKQVG